MPSDGEAPMDGAVARAVPALALDRLQERLLEAFYGGRGANTVKAYQRDHEDFRAFLARQDGLEGWSDSAERAARLLLTLPPGAANALALGYRNDLIRRGLAPATVNRRLAALRSVVALGKTLGLTACSLEVGNVEAAAYRDTRGPGRDGVRAVMAKAGARADAKGARDVAIVRLLHDVALRRGEVVSLDLEHYDGATGALFILGKGRRDREAISLPAVTRRAVEAWIAARGDRPGPLFHRLDQAGSGEGRLTGEAVRLLVRALGEGVGLTLRPHGFRHAAITTALDRSNGNVRAVQRFSRHRDVRTLQTYDDNRADLGGQMAVLVVDED
jgi:integrase/recombinase XerC